MDRRRDLLQTFAISALLSVATAICFYPVVHNGFVHFDDQDYLTENPHVNTGFSLANVSWAFTTGHAGNWHPLTWLSHMLDWQLFGPSAAGHHVMNVLLHGANAVLLFLFLNQVTGHRWRSALVAAFFALHPLRVESVAWASERKDVLSGLFFILTIWAYCRYGGIPGQAAAPCRPRVWYGAALVLFALGLMSKSMLVTVPCLLLLLDFWPLGRFEPSFKTRLGPLILEKIPFFLISAAAGVVTFLVQQHQGAVAPHGLPIESRVANAFLAYTGYIGKIVWPGELAVFYPHPAILRPELRDWFDWRVAAAALLVMALCLAAFRVAKREPFLFVGWFWYLGTLVPVIGLIQVGEQAMADRYTYLPGIGVLIAVVWGLSEMVPKFSIRPVAFSFASAAALLVLGILTWRQTQTWRDDFTLFGHALKVTEKNGVAHLNLGAALELKGKVDAALDHYWQALAFDPTPETHFNLGHALNTKGDTEAAAEEYNKALAMRPDYASAHNNLSQVLLKLGKLDEAEQHVREAIRLAPKSAPAHLNMGKVLATRGNFPEAETAFETALLLDPQMTAAELELGLALAAEGKLQEALPRLQHSVQIFPDSAGVRVALANTLWETGLTNRAKELFDEAIRLDPGLPAKEVAQAQTFAGAGQPVPALACLTQAVRLAPQDPEAREALGLLLAQLGRVQEALEHFEVVVATRPDARAYYNLGLALVALGRHAEAIPAYRKAVELQADWPAALNDLAWILATHPRADLRSGPEAVRLAEKACQLAGDREPRYLGTLDAAYAEAGRFEDAIKAACKARDLAQAGGMKDVAEAAERRLARYREKQPFRLN
jgi:protein O-mannosyl-transferase